MQRFVGRYSPLLGCLLLAFLQAAVAASEFRALWVDAWGAGFLDSSQVDQLISDCRTYNFNAIVVQMRRRGDAFYNQTVNDPKTTAIAANCDALQDLLTKAHSGSPRLEVHCWVVTFPIWSSTTAPSQPGHVFNLHPEYLMRDSAGATWIGEGYYLDPGHPEATHWNYVMATNIVRRYAIDGFHWDYIRYPQQNSGYNPTAIARYNAEFGLSGHPATSDAQFANWRRRQVTDFLRWVNAELLAIRPDLQLSCSVFGSRSDAYNARFQDWAAWNAEGILDLCLPMDYTADNALMQARVDDAYANQGVRRVYIGQAGYLNTKENTLTQLRYVRNKPLSGFAIFDYGQPSSVDERYLTLGYLKTNFQATWTSTPTLPWKSAPTKAILRGTVQRQDTGAAVYNATVTLAALGRTQRTEPHGAFAFFETAPGSYTVSATAANLGTVATNVTLSAGTNLAVALILPLDATPPVLSGVAATGLTDASATIDWTTDETANSTVDYGTTAAYGLTVSNSALGLSHSISLINLLPNTAYHYRVRSRNSAGLESVSGDFTFTTHPAGVIDDVIVDDNEAEISAGWIVSSYTGFYGGYRYNAAGSGTETVTFRPNLPRAGNYRVYVGYIQGANRTTAAPHIIYYHGGSQTVYVNQQINGSQWWLLGTFNFAAGTTGRVVVTDGAASGNVIVDVVRFEYVPSILAPVISGQPRSLTVRRGQDAAFSVTAAGTEPLVYQWRFDGVDLAGATASSYTRVNAQTNHSGDYSVTVSNIAGAVTSLDARLTVTLPQPPGLESIAVLAGGQVRLMLAGETGVVYAVDAANNLTNWSQLLAGMLTNSPQVILIPPPAMR